MSIFSARRSLKASARRKRYERARNMMRNNMSKNGYIRQDPATKEWIKKLGAKFTPVGDAESMYKGFPFCLPKSRKNREPAKA